MISTTSFIENVLPCSKIPCREVLKNEAANIPVKIPFALMTYDNRFYSEELSPPGWFVEAAFETREEAENELVRKIEADPNNCYRISKNEIQPLREFSKIRLNSKNSKDYKKYKMTKEDLADLHKNYLNSQTSI